MKRDKIPLKQTVECNVISSPLELQQIEKKKKKESIFTLELESKVLSFVSAIANAQVLR